MIHEWRSYRLKPGAAADYLTLLADQGLPLVTRHLPLMGYWLAETGGLNVIHHLWAYTGWAEREAARAALSGEEGWTKTFIPRAFALVEDQETRFLRLEQASATYDTALAQRRREHPVRKGGPLYAPECAGLVMGARPPDAIAQWLPLSGDPRPMALLPRSADPVPAAPIPGTTHNILRPLIFSPL